MNKLAWLVGVVSITAGLAAAIYWRGDSSPAGHGHDNGHGVGLKQDDWFHRPLVRPGYPPASLAQLQTDEAGVLLVNFWATWCAPCRHEMPLLQSAAAELEAVKMVGIAIDDEAKVAAFVAETGITYDILLAGADIFDYLKDNGNPAGALPFSLLLDGDGGVLAAKIGEFHSVGDIVGFARKAEKDKF